MPLSVAEAVPTRGDGEADVPFISAMEWGANAACGQSVLMGIVEQGDVRHTVRFQVQPIHVVVTWLAGQKLASKQVCMLAHDREDV